MKKNPEGPQGFIKYKYEEKLQIFKAAVLGSIFNTVGKYSV